MKNFSALVVLTTLVIAMGSCKSKKEPVVATGGPVEKVAALPAGVPAALKLNGSSKWQADALTTNNVNLLQKIISNFPPNGEPTATSYATLASDLQTALNKLVKECSMKGPGHDALHDWLLPLLSMVKQLQHAGSVEAAGIVVTALNSQVNRYYQYFE